MGCVQLSSVMFVDPSILLRRICGTITILVTVRSRVLNGPENYNPTRPPALLHCFPSYICYRNFAQRRQVCVCPSPWSSSQTYSSPHMNSDDSQQTIYNLQPARNVFYKKGSPRPNLTRLICVYFQPKPGPNLQVRSALSGRADPFRILVRSMDNGG